MKHVLCRTAVVVCVLLMCAGCINEKVHGGKVMYTYELWTFLLPLLGGLGLAMGVWLARNMVPAKWVSTLVFAGVLLAAVSPSLFVQHVLVDTDHVEAVIGPWWKKEKHAVRFVDIRDIRVESGEGKNMSGESTTYVFYVFRKKAGGEERIHRGELMLRAEKTIYRLASARGVLCP